MSGLMTFYKKSHHEQYKVCDDEVAERVGFEPRYREVQLISSLLVSVSTYGRFVSVSGRLV